MALPKIDVPTFKLTLPISKKEIRYRPFLVKEQKILLMAMETNEKEIIQDNIKQILSNCLLDEIDIDSFPMIDIEYYFLHLRAKSVGELVESKYKCENVVNGDTCNNVMDTKFNILDVQVEYPEKVEDIIKLTPTVGIKLKYPNFDVVERIQELDSVTDAAFELIVDCIEYIFDDDAMYYPHETSKEEMIEFLESLTKDQFDKIEKFVNNMPKLKKTIEVKCSKCGFEHKIDVEGLDNFFV